MKTKNVTTNVVSENVIVTFEEICIKAQKDGINPYKLLLMQLAEISPTFADESDKEKFFSLEKEILELQTKISNLQEEIKPLQSKGYLQSFENILHQISTHYPKNSGDNIQLQKVENIIKYYKEYNDISTVENGKQLAKIAENTLIVYSKKIKHIETKAKILDLYNFAVSFGASQNFATYRKAYNKYNETIAK